MTGTFCPQRLLLTVVLISGSIAAPALAQQTDDLVPPAFAMDSAKSAAIRSIEAGEAPEDTTVDTAAAASRRDSLANKLFKRGPYVGVTLGVAFANHSARQLFADHMTASAEGAGERILQRHDPVHIFFPAGLLVGLPVFPYFDVWLRTEHVLANPIQPLYTHPERIGYTVTGLAQSDNDPANEYAYTTQAHLAGIGGRWLVPVSFLTVADKPGLYLAYTHFWSFGTTGLRTEEGSLAAQRDASGAGYEIQAGFQQDFDQRLSLTGGLAFSRLSFASNADWDLLLETAPPNQAEWTLQSMRLILQLLYQFGRNSEQ